MTIGFYNRLKRIREIQGLNRQNMNAAEIAMYLKITERIVREDLKCGELLSKFLLEDCVHVFQQERELERLTEAKKIKSSKKKPEDGI